MAKNTLVINIDIRETRVALIENGVIAELHIERHAQRGTLGNIVLGKVSRVLPGMQAAFIDIGQERAAFLHVEDLIRPDDFEAYLAGHRMPTRSEDRPNDASPEDAIEAADAEAGEAGPAPAEAEAEDDEEAQAAQAEAEEHTAELQNRAAAAAEAAEAAEPAEDDDEDEPEVEAEAPDSDDEDERVSEPEEPEALQADAGDEPADSDEDEIDAAWDAPAPAAPAAEDLDLPRVEGEAAEAADDEEETGDVRADVPVGDPESPAAEGEAAAGDDAGATAKRTRRGGRGRRRRRSTTDVAGAIIAPAVAPPPPVEDDAPREASAVAPREGRGRRSRNDRGGNREGGGSQGGGGNREGRGARADRGRGGDKRGGSRSSGTTSNQSIDRGPNRGRRDKDPLRVSKSTPIRNVVREGQEVVVQVSKEPIGTKGARVTSHISLPGRYVVYLPTVEHVGISKRIGSDKERGRLREAIEAMKPPQGGLIVRTLAEGLTKKSLKNDVGYLVRLWGEIAKKREQAPKAPSLLYAELDLVLKTARDLFTDDVEKIIIDDKEEHGRLVRFVEMFMPERVGAIELYEGDEPIFDEYGIEEEIGRALSRKVPLASGGHLVIDQAEALTAIDVNTGRYVGKGSKDLEDTILQTNLEAVEEIAYQLRFRNIGGLIILDLIDMERISNREKVRRRLEQLLLADKAKTTLNRISDLGLIEMTRKRTRESLGRIMNEPCFYCDGTGNLQSRQTIAYEILRQIKRERGSLRGYSVVVNAHPAVVDCLRNEERSAVSEAERRYQRRIELVPRKEYHLEQFDLIGK
jgi:ribonuclease G